MSKLFFEDKFSELQADMVSICLNNVKKRAEKIYIYCSYENGVISSSYFYNINGNIVERHKLNEAIKIGEERYDVSVDRQKDVIKIINSDIEELLKICKEYGRPMPTEMKIVYDVKNNSHKAEYKYELVYSNDAVKTASDIAAEWFEEVKKGNE